MKGCVTIIMYHYVRKMPDDKFPYLKALDIDLFKEQISYVGTNYNIITSELLIEAIRHGKDFPKKAALLSFDDGFMDHYTNVFPLLKQKKLQGSFYICAKPLKENTVLDVHKIQFILARMRDEDILIDRIYQELDTLRSRYNLESNEYYYKHLAQADMWHSEKAIFIRRLLQKELAQEPRRIIIDKLFKKYVTEDEVSFCKELYMDIGQIKEMRKSGMHIGGHGYDHYWLDGLLPEEIEHEIDGSLDLIKSIYGNVGNWTFSYPYGGYNQHVIDILNRKGCKFALTIKPAIADLNKDNIFGLPRIDTIHLPMNKVDYANM